MAIRMRRQSVCVWCCKTPVLKQSQGEVALFKAGRRPCISGAFLERRKKVECDWRIWDATVSLSGHGPRDLAAVPLKITDHHGACLSVCVTARPYGGPWLRPMNFWTIIIMGTTFQRVFDSSFKRCI
jgi:hypothetical protein